MSTMTMKHREALLVLARPVDTKVEPEKWKDRVVRVEESCRFLEKAARLYGIRRVARALRSLDEFDGPLWFGYWRRWRARQERHVMPQLLLIDPYFVSDNIAARLVFAPRAEAAA